MASPFVPVPVPMDKSLLGGKSKPRRPQRAASLGSVSGSLESSSSVAREEYDRNSQRQSRCKDRAGRSRTPPPLQSSVAQARLNGSLEPSAAYSTCPRSISDPAGSQQLEERPITPTVLGYEVMEERAKFTVKIIIITHKELIHSHKTSPNLITGTCIYHTGDEM